MNSDLKYTVVIYNDNWSLAQDWCEQNIGEFNDTWYKLGIDPMDQIFNQDRETESVWYFRNHKDAVAFKLKWA